jgi:hypothetical protein
MAGSWAMQTRALIVKNLLIKRRYKRQTAFEVRSHTEKEREGGGEEEEEISFCVSFWLAL